MSKQEIPRDTLRGITNWMIELADNDKIPTVQEIRNIDTIDTLFDFLKENYSPRKHWLSGTNNDDLQRISIQILGVHYDDFAYKMGIKNNGILPIIASLVFYMDFGIID